MPKLLPLLGAMVGFLFTTGVQGQISAAYSKKTDRIEDPSPAPPDCRETNAINKRNVAESYPFLSSDGLRLYFTSDREGGFGRFFISSRKSVQDPFAPPVVLDKNLTDGFYAGTLTADELTMCMVKSGSMYISERTNTTSGFSKPVELEGASTDYHFAPSISPDGSQIIVLVTIDGTDVIWVYDREEYAVKKVGELPVPVSGTAGPGQFSKDGLSYYFSIEHAGSENIWRYSRSRPEHNFADLQELPAQMKSLKNNLQPSLNGDGSIMVFVTSPDNLWETDDIVLVNNVQAGINAAEQFRAVDSSYTSDIRVMTKVERVPLKIYPNPFTTQIIIEMDDLVAVGALLNIYDLSGRKIMQEKISGNTSRISLDKLIAGVYIYHIIDNGGKLIFSGKLVKGSSY